MTVNGPVAPNELGVTDAHSHIYIGFVPGAATNAPVLTDEEGIGRELRAFRAAGGGAIVDCQPGGCGRDGRVLRRLSQRTGVHVIASTGFHRRVYYSADPPLFAMSVEAAVDYFLDEIRNGLVEARTTEMPSLPVYPGVIKIAAEASLAASPRSLFEAAALVAHETGYAIEMHTERGAEAEEFLAFFSAQGLPPRQLVFCHVDKRPDFALHRELAQAGVMLEYDTFFRPKYEPERNLWPLIHAMAGEGLDAQVALATDMADSALWVELGGEPGLLGIFTIIEKGLARMGLPAEMRAGMMGGNIAGRLVVGKSH